MNNDRLTFRQKILNDLKNIYSSCNLLDEQKYQIKQSILWANSLDK